MIFLLLGTEDTMSIYTRKLQYSKLQWMENTTLLLCVYYQTYSKRRIIHIYFSRECDCEPYHRKIFTSQVILAIKGVSHNYTKFGMKVFIFKNNNDKLMRKPLVFI